MRYTNLDCCGMKEIVGINYLTNNNIENEIDNLIKQKFIPPSGIKGKRLSSRLGSAHYIGSVAWGHGRSKQQMLARYELLRKYIEDNKLGTFTEAPARSNPSHGRSTMIKPFIWTVKPSGVYNYACKRGLFEQKQKEHKLQQDNYLRMRNAWRI